MQYKQKYFDIWDIKYQNKVFKYLIKEKGMVAYEYRFGTICCFGKWTLRI